MQEGNLCMLEDWLCLGWYVTYVFPPALVNEWTSLLEFLHLMHLTTPLVHL